MPPKASTGRRATRSSSRDLEAPSNQSGTFGRPHLPPLSGTPSSRRQYSYGSGAEPPPRLGSGLHRMDLRNAINQVLTRRDDEELQPQGSQSPGADADSDSDSNEPASPSPRRLNARTLDPPTTHIPATNLSSRLSALEEDNDSARSFAMESDYYGDATIASTIDDTREPKPSPILSRTRGQVLAKIPEKTVPEGSPAKASRTRSTSPAKTQPGQARVSQPARRTQQSEPPPEVDADSESVEEDEADAIDATRGHRDQANTPGPKRMRQANMQRRRADKEPASRGLDDNEEQDRESPDREEGPGITRATITRALRGPTLKPPGSTGAVPAPIKQRQYESRAAATQHTAGDPTEPRRITQVNQERSQDFHQDQTQGSQQERSLLIPQQRSKPLRPERSLGLDRPIARQRSEPFRQGPSLFAHAKDLRRNKSSAQTYPDDQERDAQIQREIQEAEKQFDSEREEQRIAQLAEQREARRRRWAWFMSWWPMTVFHRLRRQTENVNRFRDEVDRDAGPTDWTRLFYPMTYIQSLVWLFDKMMDYFVNFIDRLAGIQVQLQLSRHSNSLFWVLGSVLVGILGVAFSFIFGPTIVKILWNPSVTPGSGLSAGRISWPSLSDITDKVGGLVPSISWPSNGLDDISDLWESDDNDDGENKATQILKRFERDFANLKKASRLHNASLKKLEIVVPKVVRMELKDGKPIVTQEFWHALRDLINKDDQFLTMEKTVDGYEFTSEEQWQTIVKRLNNDPAFAKRLNSSVARIEGRLATKMIGTWDAWVNNNENRISELLGTALDKIQSAGSGREFDKRLAQIVREQLQGKEIQEIIVTRDQFLHHLQNEFATHRSEIRGELGQLESQIESFREAIHLATKNRPQGVSKAEVVSLVQGLVEKTIADMNLGSVANGKIQLHWNAELKNQVNYFAIGAGATIDAQRTSLVYDPHRKGSVSPENTAKGIASIKPLPAIAALQPWDDEGECFCAVRSENYRGNPHGATLSVLLGQTIIPQHVVIEHILPGATIDPGARPKNIEVWAYIDDLKTRSRLQDFSATQFPDDKEDWNFQKPDYEVPFVKIGQFVYQNTELHDGVHVHRLSSELQNLGAVTDQVIIRAVSNYGAVHHTCFYRVRLYGQRI